MKQSNRWRLVLSGVIGFGIWSYHRTPEPTLLSFRIGQPFEEVVKNSTYPVMERSNLPSDDPRDSKFGATWVREPAVVIPFGAEGCWTRERPYRFLIDIGIGKDVHGSKPGDPKSGKNPIPPIRLQPSRRSPKATVHFRQCEFRHHVDERIYRLNPHSKHVKLTAQHALSPRRTTMTTMTGGSHHPVKHVDSKQLLRIVIVTVLLLMIPLVAMQFTAEVNWTASDFVIMGAMLFGTGLLLQFASNRIRSGKSRLLAIGAIAFAFLFVWAEMAVGLVGSPIAGS